MFNQFAGIHNYYTDEIQGYDFTIACGFYNSFIIEAEKSNSLNSVN